jgi:hypothetical protein
MYIYYKLLGVARDADDQTIRKAYLDLVKKFSPERHPDQFKRITRAFEAIKDQRSRVGSKIMGTPVAYPLWTDALEDFLILQRQAKVPVPGLKNLVEAQRKDNGIF